MEPRGAERALMAAQELQREKGGKKKLLKEKWSLGAPPLPTHTHSTAALCGTAKTAFVM